MTKTVQYQNELHKFLIWDTAGQERVNTATIITKHTHTHTHTHLGDKQAVSLSVFAVSL